ncbi:MAG TPA: Gfo/Idh/MocA family oxidoreductase [Armatimonadota bacterium]|jgi:predicted dehydrogenase
MADNSGMDRRQFLTMGAGAMMFSMLAAEELRAQTPAAPAPPAGGGAPVNCAVIGLGAQGRALIDSLARAANAPVTAVCDTYTPAHTRALTVATKATAVQDYKQLLGRADVSAVFVATPTHQHKQIVLDAIAAGKHVYCEAPLAYTIEDAKAIALAGKASTRIFQSGLTQRMLPISTHVRKFIETDVLSKVAQIRGQYHRKTNWRRAAPTPEREQALNWRLSKATSLGLVGELGIQPLDLMNWYLRSTPVAVSGFGGILAWQDGRDVPDTVQCIFEYPEGVHLAYDATVANSFDGKYELMMGSDSAIYLRDGRGWLIKEADAKALGWEVYAHKDKLGDETGIALVADASKQLALGKEPGSSAPPAMTDQAMLNYAVDGFLSAIRTGKKPLAGPTEGYQSTVAVIKANEAVNSASRITIAKELYDL